MPSFLPSFSRPLNRDRRSFTRLRSFHLSPVAENFPAAVPGQGSDSKHKQHKPNALSVVKFEEPPKRNARTKKSRFSIAVARIDREAIPPIFWLGLAVIVSIVFVFALACTFRGVQWQEPAFKHILDDIAENTPGIVLLGENVDIDIDEPSITVRWSILACGDDYTLANSTGIHGSRRCGLPASPLSIFVDGDTKPTATFDPTEIPFDRRSGTRRSIQNLVQFDSDHVLDVHNAYLYPFDTYTLSSTIRAVSATNASIPIRKLATMELTSSFLVQASDIESYSTANTTDSQLSSSRDIDMKVKRPAEARTYALFLFAISWFLTHICLGHVYMAWRATLTLDVVKNILSSGAILAAIPQLRGSMPDAPGLDGVLIDSIGYFPQMVISGLCVVILMLTAVSRELNGAKLMLLPSLYQPPQRPLPRPKSIKIRPPPIPPPDSPIKDTTVVEYNKYRMTKHLKGEFVFPPVDSDPFHDPRQDHVAQQAHRRLKTTVGFV
ncbi:hypothetical protein L218DRAFT_684635 [Marasmius fiardii PR-910]|nr:hypothetical protein L218DRAFT_684635 [Marasmius fiardii PR-910]